MSTVNMKNTLAIATAALLTIGATSAYADGHKDGKGHKYEKPEFSEYDSNSDGMISKDEMVNFEQNKVESRVDWFFSKIDKDENGSVSEDEWNNFEERMKEKWKDKKHSKE